MPIEELLFAAGFGMYWSGVYEHFTWRRAPLTDMAATAALLSREFERLQTHN